MHTQSISQVVLKAKEKMCFYWKDVKSDSEEAAQCRAAVRSTVLMQQQRKLVPLWASASSICYIVMNKNLTFTSSELLTLSNRKCFICFLCSLQTTVHLLCPALLCQKATMRRPCLWVLEKLPSTSPPVGHILIFVIWTCQLWLSNCFLK